MWIFPFSKKPVGFFSMCTAVFPDSQLTPSRFSGSFTLHRSALPLWPPCAHPVALCSLHSPLFLHYCKVLYYLSFPALLSLANLFFSCIFSFFNHRGSALKCQGPLKFSKLIQRDSSMLASGLRDLERRFFRKEGVLWWFQEAINGTLSTNAHLSWSFVRMSPTPLTWLAKPCVQNKSLVLILEVSNYFFLGCTQSVLY